VKRLGRLWRYAVSDGVPRRSLIVAVIVGAILNLINQGDALLGRAPLSLIKLALTFLVPYCVATYGAVAYRLSLEASAAGRDGTGSTD
jgi:hypothetical protein